MTYTYSEPDSQGSFDGDNVSNVRYLAEDTSPAAPFSLSDGEIAVELAATAGNLNRAAANVAYKMGRRYSKEAVTSKSVGNTSLSRNYGTVATSYMALANDLRSGMNAGYAIGVPIFTGADVPQQFGLGQFDYPSGMEDSSDNDTLEVSLEEDPSNPGFFLP